MFRNYLAAAVNNLSRNRLFAAISIVGLAVGMAAAILTGLYIRDELTFDRFIPGYRQVYVVGSSVRLPGRPTTVTDLASVNVGEQLKMDFKEVQAAARLNKRDQGVRHGGVEALEPVGWADPDFFSILPLPVLSGDPVATLRRPDGVVITRAAARKYFGQDDPVGQVLELNHAIPLRIGAVLKDLPSNTHLVEQIYASGLNAASPFRSYAAYPPARGTVAAFDGHTYVRIATAAEAARVEAGLPAFHARRQALPNGKMLGGITEALQLVPLADLHLYPLGLVGIQSSAQGSKSVLVSLGLIAVLIVAVAGINFVNLMTARATRRAVEVGVRKAAGARRGDLIVQFIGEAVIYALIGLLLAIVALELVLPWVRTRLDRPLDFAYWRDPGVLAATLGMSLGMGVLAGTYPALVQSSFRPANVLKGGLPLTSGSERVRAGLATVQFAVLIGLILAVVVIAGQTRYALNEGLRVDKARMMVMDISPPPDFLHPLGASSGPMCRDAFVDQVRALPGVQGAACSDAAALDLNESEYAFDRPGGGSLTTGLAIIDYGFLELYGLRPVAGRFFSREHPADETALPPPATFKSVLINETAARALGYASPIQAVGQSLRRSSGTKVAIPIVGVVPDFAFDMVHGPQRPMAYLLRSPELWYLSVKLNGRDIPETIKAIDALWKRTGSPRPPSHRFVDDYLQTIYAGAIRQGYLVDALCGVAVLIACLGLFGLAAFTAERRTKEIGIRKAMGAQRTDIVRLLLWQFTKPVLWADLIAWPLGWWALDRWLHGFARHIPLSPWLFLAASAAALAIAWATVLAHTVKVAGAKPVGALRYE